MSAGRPVTWTPEKRQEAIDTILFRIATSRDSIALIVDNDKSLPSETTFFKWKREDEKLAQDYAHAKEDQADLIFEEMLEIADTPKKGVTTKTTQNGTDITEEDMLGHRRLQIDTRKWVLGKLRPKKYGDFQRNEVTGADGAALTFKLLKADENL